MKAITLGKGLCVLLLLLCISVVSYAELIMSQGIVCKQVELNNDPIEIVIEMPGIRQIKEYYMQRKIARFRFRERRTRSSTKYSSLKMIDTSQSSRMDSIRLAGKVGSRGK